MMTLRRLQAAGVISELREQVPYTCVVNDIKLCRYVADFVYIQDGVQVVEDIKSFFTKKLPVYRLKKKLMLACFGIQILET